MAKKRKFDDPGTDGAYVRAERLAHLPTFRIAMLFGIAFHTAAMLAALLQYAGVTTLISAFTNEMVGLATIYHLASIAVLGAGFGFCIIKNFAHHRWVDAALFSLYALCLLAFLAAHVATEFATVANENMTGLVLAGFMLVTASVLFVANVRWFIIWAVGFVTAFGVLLTIFPGPVEFKFYQFILLLIFLWLAIFINTNLDLRARAVFAAQLEVEREQAKVEELLFNVLPQSVATRLRSGEAVADSFSDVSVIFADVVGFSQLAKTLSPGHLVNLLNRFFSIADQCAERRGIEKVKTIGDAYLAVANGTASGECGACEAVAFGKDLIAAMRALAEETEIDINLRVGIHTGPVVGGVVGESRLTYDYWGDTMNIASRIESAARPNAIAVSASTFFQCAKLYEFAEPEAMLLKGVGETKVYHLDA